MTFSLTRRVTAVAAGLALAVSLAACSSEDTDSSSAQGSESSSSDSAFPRTVETQDKDKHPTEITIEQRPQRIVSASVSLTGALLALDAPVVGSGGGNPKAPMFADDTGFGLSWDKLAEEKKVEPLFTIGSANAEAILAQNPDLVVMSNVGADNGVEIYDQLKDVVPVQVIDYTGQSWEATTREVAKAAGLEEKADKVIEDYEKSVAKAKDKITIDGPVNVIALSKEGAVNFFTKESPQGKIFTDLGIELSVPGDDLVGSSEQGSARSDVKAVNAENVPLALDGKTVFVLNIDSDGDADHKVRDNEQLAQTTAVSEDRVYGLDGEFFRIDAIAAQDLVKHLLEDFS
ncbi:Fe2+-enterobactin ABC transporter substrate-binding protein [Corynebacterium sp. zg-331]|uniref:Fe2+-enterobactin ABC transporter substrate-binding protein n=1 Tax=unclassified Corynebacterium TaxID=2624378 RepID=UPI00128C1374|nr:MULTISPECIES: Fe2+-enterobactin ABC transporter substrate-binding protein [unclassified Corynebacterium]MBC3185628.1 Fe2+-enterobactin ABC transporter substrate-binding protein [Corynebacterium sp. zg-331]MPV52122.1 Fe2+-enterobactin ABC transporter substrate-binding protein [Corynebacterium sp. zg331]